MAAVTVWARGTARGAWISTIKILEVGLSWNFYINDLKSLALAASHGRKVCGPGDGRGDGEVGIYYGGTIGAGDGPGGGWGYDCEFGWGHGYGWYGLPNGDGHSRRQWLAP